MLVLDASVIVDLLLNTPRSEAVRTVLTDRSESLHAPDYMPIECINVLRLVWTGRDRQLGDTALDDLDDLGITYHPFDDPYRRHLWSMTGSLTTFDAGYVTLCQALGATLVTSDQAPARSSSGLCDSIEVLTPRGSAP